MQAGHKQLEESVDEAEFGAEVGVGVGAGVVNGVVPDDAIIRAGTWEEQFADGCV